jgi:hypothetical protein
VTSKEKQYLATERQKSEAITNPVAGDVWVSKRMTRMVVWAYLGNRIQVAQPKSMSLDRCDKWMEPCEFRRWCRTATLVSRGRGDEKQ